MALNFSHRPIFPTRLPDESPVQNGAQDSDVRELLPADPFEMHLTAITGWLENCNANYAGHQSTEVSGGLVDPRHFEFSSYWDFCLNRAAIDFRNYHGYQQQFDHRRMKDVGVSGSGFFPDQDLGSSRYDCGGSQVSGTLKGVIGDTYKARGSTSDLLGPFSWEFNAKFVLPDAYSVHKNGNSNHGKNVEVLDDDDGPPHSAMRYALPYLGVRDWLSIELVCKSFRQTLKTDLLYNNIQIYPPLNNLVTDDNLLNVTNKASGELQCLSLAECRHITEDALRRILDANPKLVKLSVSACQKISIDGAIKLVRTFQMKTHSGIKRIRVSGLAGLEMRHYEELLSLLGIDNNHIKVNHYKPHFYNRRNRYLSCEDDRPIDIEVCPGCQKLKLLYDCPVECCQSDDDVAQQCRACINCIPRCIDCGKCISNRMYVETFGMDNQCSDCMLPLTLESTRYREDDTSQEEPVISLPG